jgi:hydrogenase/urease accessory protein HupE
MACNAALRFAGDLAVAVVLVAILAILDGHAHGTGISIPGAHAEVPVGFTAR